jgi:molybdopterin molybdotransferase
VKTKVTVEEAWDLITRAAPSFGSQRRALVDACGSVCDKDVHAPIGLPPFDNSAVDGYALGSLERDFFVVSTLGAGDFFAGQLEPSQACRIMTGAKIPEGTRAVVMQEYVDVVESRIRLRESVAEHDHIRWAGEDVEKGQLVLSESTRVTAAHVGLLAALGIGHLEVRRSPTVAIVSTGSELVDPGLPLAEGEVYYCTGPMMSALCRRAGAHNISVAKIADDEEAIVEALQVAKAADIIIQIGGMAGGLFDYGRSSFEKIGVLPVFFEGQWRPGKPLFFGTLNSKLVFGLPGNPVAALVMFKIFIEPIITGRPLCFGKAAITGAKPKASDKAQFLRARKIGDALELVAGQGSHQLYSLSLADAIVWVPPGGAMQEQYAYLPLEP